DHRGNKASATVTVTVTGAAPVPITGNGNTSGELSVTDGTTLVRGGGQYADFYQFRAVKEDLLTLYLTPSSFAGHMYLRDPEGKLRHSEAHLANGLDATFYSERLDMSGTYTLEVTSHAADETGTYGLNFNKQFPGDRVELVVNGVT